MRNFLRAQLAIAALLATLALASMTDRNTSSPGSNLVNKLTQMIFCLTATTTYTPGTGGGSAFTVTPPFLLRLMTAQGSNTSNGTGALGHWLHGRRQHDGQPGVREPLRWHTGQQQRRLLDCWRRLDRGGGG